MSAVTCSMTPSQYEKLIIITKNKTIGIYTHEITIGFAPGRLSITSVSQDSFDIQLNYSCPFHKNSYDKKLS
jgi:hypothetical protein